MTKLYLFVPAEEDTHRLSAALASSSGMDLREAGRLRGDVARCTPRARLRHALVAVPRAVSQEKVLEVEWDERGAQSIAGSVARKAV